jgi:hypothetical protein
VAGTNAAGARNDQTTTQWQGKPNQEMPEIKATETRCGNFSIWMDECGGLVLDYGRILHKSISGWAD